MCAANEGQRIKNLRSALKKIIALENTEHNEWDAVERVIPEMVVIAVNALNDDESMVND